MLTKTTKRALGGHTAGIFADMSIDGPEIGTLVAIFDRAKNLPNRKTMGKQNPYCAARLGKEAKKTDTDMRGGQTPRWDQELRFTVHESPDYYQLKLSVFNDDKKTDLIGETWVDLKTVVIPGGGQNDLWHNLQCKGKYAGEIRIELTYYDTRPKDEAVIERRKEAAAGGKAEGRKDADDSHSSSRKTKAPKRRPLPADPTGATPSPRPSNPELPVAASKHSNPRPSSSRTQPSSQSKQASKQQPPRSYETPDDVHQNWETPNPRPPTNTNPPHQQTTHHNHQTHHHGHQTQHQYPPDHRDMHHESSRVSRSSRNQPLAPPPTHEDNFHPPPPSDYRYEHEPADSGSFPNHPVDDPYHQEPSATYRNQHETPPRHNSHPMANPEHRHSGQNSYPPISRSSPHGDPEGHNYHASSDIVPPSHFTSSSNHGNHHHTYSSSAGRNEVFRDSPLRNTLDRQDYYQHQEYRQPQVHDDEDDDDDIPPPPPIHRDGLRKPVPPPQPPSSSYDHSIHNDATQPISMPEPLHINSQRAVQTQGDEFKQEYIAYSPTHSNSAATYSNAPQPEPLYSVSPTPSYHSYHQQEPTPSYDRPTTSNGESVPSSLMVGYDPAYVEEPSQMTADHWDGRRQSNVSMHAQPMASSNQMMRTSPAPMPERKSPRASPDPRQIPARKSVSPQPHTQPDTDSMQGIPFSPDSYDALNPSVNDSSVVKAPASPYETPEAAMEAARQHEVEKLRGLGPIIGNNGRVIDPSDHLPADTWAPEPDRKSRKPEVVVRFKHTNKVGPRPSPREREQRDRDQAVIRPRSSVPSSHYYQKSQSSLSQQASQAQGQSTPSQQPSNSNRLQKQSSRPQSYAPPSSNRIDHTHHTPSPRVINPLRERENFSTYGHSPSGNPHTPPYHHGSSSQRQLQTSPSPSTRASPSGGGYYYQSSGPPLPAKVPIHPGSQNYPAILPAGDTGNNMNGVPGGEMVALSEEMKRIDIGVGKGGGGGSRRPRSSYVGAYGQ